MNKIKITPEPLVWAVGCTVLLALLVFFLQNFYVSLADSILQQEIYFRSTNVLIYLMFLVTQIGSLGALVGAILAALLIRRKYDLAIQLSASGIVAYLLSSILKAWLAIPRPDAAISGVEARLEPAIGFGFPSGHTAIAMVLFLILAPYVNSKHKIIFGLLVFFVGLSRVVLGVHYVSDVLGGLLVGSIAVMLVKSIHVKG